MIEVHDIPVKMQMKHVNFEYIIVKRERILLLQREDDNNVSLLQCQIPFNLFNNISPTKLVFITIVTYSILFYFWLM